MNVPILFSKSQAAVSREVALIERTPVADLLRPSQARSAEPAARPQVLGRGPKQYPALNAYSQEQAAWVLLSPKDPWC